MELIQKPDVFVKDNAIDELHYLTSFGRQNDRKVVYHDSFRGSYFLAKVFPYSCDTDCKQFRLYPHARVAVSLSQLKEIRKWLQHGSTDLSLKNGSVADKLIEEFVDRGKKKRLIVQNDNFGYYLTTQYAADSITKDRVIDVDSETREDDGEEMVVTTPPPPPPSVEWKDAFEKFYFGLSTEKGVSVKALSKYIQHKEAKETAPRKRKRKVAALDEEEENEQDDDCVSEVEKDYNFINSVILAGMKLHGEKDVVDEVIKYSDSLSIACGCSSDDLQKSIMYAGVDYLNGFFVRHEQMLGDRIDAIFNSV